MNTQAPDSGPAPGPEPTPAPAPVEAAPRSIAKIAEALAGAQGDFKTIHRDRTVRVRMKSGGEYTFSYAPLETIMASVKESLAKHGLSVTQSIKNTNLRTTLFHKSGEFMLNDTPIFVGESGAQAYGSALTYARRYGITLLLNLVADDDDDGNAADGNSAEAVKKGEANVSDQRQPQAARPAPAAPDMGKEAGKDVPRVSPEGVTAIKEALKKATDAGSHYTEKTICEWVKVDKLENVPRVKLPKIMQALEQARQDAAQAKKAEGETPEPEDVPQ